MPGRSDSATVKLELARALLTVEDGPARTYTCVAVLIDTSVLVYRFDRRLLITQEIANRILGSAPVVGDCSNVRCNYMQERLQGKVALVTGAFGGIGSAIAQRFLAEGAAVVANDLSGPPTTDLQASVRHSEDRLVTHLADHSKESDVVEMMERTRELFGGLDILVNNAFAAFDDTDIETLREDDWDRTLNACLKGPFLCTKHAIPLMKERGGGSIVSISSVNALRAVSETAYTAAKGGLISMMRLVAADFAEWNIRSNVICPGTVATSASLDYWEQFPSGFADLKRMYPLGRIGDPVDIANYALFLASDESSWVTGTVHAVDGGLMAGTKLSVR